MHSTLRFNSFKNTMLIKHYMIHQLLYLYAGCKDQRHGQLRVVQWDFGPPQELGDVNGPNPRIYQMETTYQ